MPSTTVTVTIEANEIQVSLRSPFTPELAPMAKSLGGKWDSPNRQWVFDVRDEARVRDLARQVYGTDGTGDVPLVDVRVPTAQWGEDREAIVIVAGRIVAERRERDQPVQLGEGVILHSGQFPDWAGSKRYPEVGVNDAVLEVRGVPAPIAASNQWEIVARQPRPGANTDRRTALLDERNRLGERIAQIDQELESL